MQRRIYGHRKDDLLGGLEGTVLEIGPGSGLNLAYLPTDVRYIGIEPNVHFHPRLVDAARRRGVSATIETGIAEDLPLAYESVDVVISTLVMCSVADQRRALGEVRRVLRPGGTFVFIEHVAAPSKSFLRRVQRVVRGPWRLLADGCQPDRETAASIRAAGFSEVEVSSFSLPLGVVSPHVSGRAWK